MRTDTWKNLSKNIPRNFPPKRDSKRISTNIRSWFGDTERERERRSRRIGAEKSGGRAKLRVASQAHGYTRVMGHRVSVLISAPRASMPGAHQTWATGHVGRWSLIKFHHHRLPFAETWSRGQRPSALQAARYSSSTGGWIGRARAILGFSHFCLVGRMIAGWRRSMNPSVSPNGLLRLLSPRLNNTAR